MPWVAIVAGLAGAALSSEAAKDAAKTQSGAAGNSTAAQLAMYRQSRADQTPYRTVGTSALARLAGGTGLGGAGGVMTGANRQTIDPLVDTSNGAPSYNPTLYASSPEYRKAWDEVAAMHQAGFGSGYVADSDPNWIDSQVRMRLPEMASQPAGAQPAGQQGAPNDLTRRFSLADLENDPVYQQSYQAGLDMGMKRLQASLGASGTLNSGGAAKAMARYASDYNSQKAGDAFNRFQVQQGNEYNRLASLAGIGQTATNQTQAAGQNMANNVSGIQQNLGNNLGAAQIAQGNIWGQSVQGIGNWYSNDQMLNRYMANRNGGYGGNSGGYVGGGSWTQTPDNNPYMASGGDK